MSDMLWDLVYAMAKRRCWDEASEDSDEWRIWDELMYPHQKPDASPVKPEEGCSCIHYFDQDTWRCDICGQTLLGATPPPPEGKGEKDE